MEEPKVKSFEAATNSGSTITYHTSNVPPSENKKAPNDGSNPSTTPPKRAFLYDARVRIALIIGVGAIICLAIFFSGFTSGNTSNPQALSETIYLRLASISAISRQYTSRIQSSQLRTLNTSLIDAVSETQDSFRSLSTTLDLKPMKISAKISAAELRDYNRLTATLDSSIADGTFDITYANMMSSQLTLLSNHYKRLYSLVSDKDFKIHAANTMNTFDALSDRFSTLSD